MDEIAFGLIPISEKFCQKITAFLQQFLQQLRLDPEIISIKKGRKPNEIVFQTEGESSISLLVFQQGEHLLFLTPCGLQIYECRISKIIMTLSLKSP